QTSAATGKGEQCFHVVVDHQTGKDSKTEPITSGDDLTAAKAQNQAMAKTKTSLRAAVAKAVKANQGAKAISVTPASQDGHPTANITLLIGEEWKTVSEKLD